MPSRRGSLFCWLLAAALAGGCARPGGGRDDALVLQTNWSAQPEQGGYYQAQARGFFREAGIAVRIDPGGPGAFPLQKVAAGQADFGIGRSDDVILAVQQGLPLVMVCAQLEHDPQGIAVHAESPVRGFADLDGRTLKAVVGQAWLGYLKQRYRIDFGVVPENYGFAQFAADPAMIQQCYLTSDAYYCSVHHIAVRMLPVYASGYDAYRVVFTSREVIRRRPEAVRAFVRASIRGWADFLDGDPGPGAALLAKDNPENTPELVAYDRRVLREGRLAAGDPDRGERLGLLTRRRLEAELAILLRLGLLPAPLPLERVASFEFLPEDLRAAAER
jgi:NitT/TauT family transport system substrate-binding protein